MFWHLFHIESVICPTDRRGETTARWWIYLPPFNITLYARQGQKKEEILALPQNSIWGETDLWVQFRGIHANWVRLCQRYYLGRLMYDPLSPTVLYCYGLLHSLRLVCVLLYLLCVPVHLCSAGRDWEMKGINDLQKACSHDSSLIRAVCNTRRLSCCVSALRG